MSSRFLTLAVLLSLLLVSTSSSGQPTDHPIPDAEARQTALASIRELFEKEIEAANTSKQKSDLARQLIKLGDETADDPTARFVLYRVARDLAADAGQLDLAMQAITTLAEQYQVKRVEMVVAMLQRAARADRSRSHRVEVARYALEAAETELDDWNHEGAKDLVELAVTAARSARDSAMIKRAIERRAQIETLAEQSAKVSAARATLQNDPSDAAANQVLGVFYCFMRNQWEDGLPHLALGENKIHQDLAARELAGADAAADMLKLADDWWDLAEQQKDPEQTHLRQHASVWYEKSLPELNGLEKIKVERRLAEIKKSAGSTTSPIGDRSTREPEWVDLLANIDIQQQTIRGDWRTDGKQLALAAPTSLARFRLPAAPHGSYELQIEFTRVEGNDAVCFVLPVGQTVSLLQFSGWQGQFGGLAQINGAKSNERRNPTSRPSQLDNDHKYNLLVRVQVGANSQAAVQATLDGKLFVQWQGPQSALSPDPFWRVDPVAIAVASNLNRIVVHSARLRAQEPAREAASDSDNSKTADGIAADPGGDREPSGVKSKLMGTQPSGMFEDTGPKGSLLVGFRTSTRNAFNGNCIGSIQPIYEAQRSDRYWGALRGTENENITTVVAKDGYAVGAINARAGLVVNGFEIIFMRRTRTGLDPRDAYKSQWLGRTDGGSGPTVLGGNGRPVVGIFGAADSRLLLGIGLIGAQ